MPRETAIPTDPNDLDPRLTSGLQGLLNVQRPVVISYLRNVRRANPDASPAELIEILQKRYLTAVTIGGAGTGAIAAVPGIGTVASLGVSALETAGFLEASALYAQAVTELHGIRVEDPERANTLVMTLMLGTAGADLVKQLAGQASGGPGRSSFWGDLVTERLPKAVLTQIKTKIQRTFLKRFLVRRSAGLFGRLVPFGIGAVIGGTGNHVLAKRVIEAAQDAFGPAPHSFTGELSTITLKPSKEERSAEKEARQAQKRQSKQARAELEAAEKDARKRADELKG
ncbi:hypothetical protein [Desertivibrio insolitus]|uniref:hypothetical protein n=1 Tax=Herbiconiux sp. SYSU D00978 TaxID=2812562 RepID=UPI001A97B22F|nr:hypothetical protein [Herbiconiux sp. SYSU D00978]